MTAIVDNPKLWRDRAREAHKIAEDSGLDREVGIERPADLHHLLAGETAAGGKLGDRFEVMVLPTRQAPAQHASRDAADVLEAVHDVARDEDDAAGTRLGGLIADGHLIEALDDEQNLFLFKMDMIVLTLRPPVFDRHVLALDVTEIT
jgi:hypothetical protein